MVVLSNFLAPQDGIRHEEQNATLYINNREIGKGTLYITESVLSWINNDTRQGFSLEYLHISLHAISRDVQVHPRQCLYMIVDIKVDFPDDPTLEPNDNNESNTDDNNDDDDDDDSDAPITEMRFAPDNINSLEAMFQAMKECQALHPDPQDSFSDAEEDIYEDAEEDDFEYYEVGAGDAPYIIPPDQVGANHNGTETEEVMDVEAGQFEDAEEDP
ncbi:PREDICTED: methylosome subunit pICln [Ceratosolen solmsi marchali]|uniref:Methylosome subunit pICln n=1 Tax=Ceratosolen solmsi marchali TaxID=326594 RepID=A0AAJ6YBB4_9HYME|nr:PREDICTED: methylosome subunit pICln [Ceratosolen solmsi marchali]XP_011494170.1 PREDICTED: methylosome subunit pICln [Ceratosolen solmsi marchali]